MAELSEAAAPPVPERQVVALVLPALLCELAEPNLGQPRTRKLPLGVVLGDPSQTELTSVLSAVSEGAARVGVRAGQTVAEARAMSARLVVRAVSPQLLEQALSRIAEIALAFGAVVAFSAPDTVWVDVTGAAHLFGGEAGLLVELVSRVREAGHRVRAVLGPGPRLAQAFARFGELGAEGYRVIPSSSCKRELGELPIRALELPRELEGWLVRLGLLSVSGLSTLPSSALATRLGDCAPRVLGLMTGRDDTPLTPYTPARILLESTSWEDGSTGIEPLLFVLRGLTARLGGRLSGRGEAAGALRLTIVAETSTARFREAPRATRLDFALPKPLWRAEELFRIVASRLERVELGAPSVGLELEVTELTEATPRQLELGLWGASTSQALDELPIVLAELTAELGEENVGVLRAVDSHRPELASTLVPALPKLAARSKKSRRGRASQKPAPARAAEARVDVARLVHRVTRWLKEPVAFEAPLRLQATVALGRRLYTIDSLRFEQRLEAVEWWSRPVSRDYVRLVLRGTEGVVEGLVFVDRDSGKRYWQGIAD